MRNIHLLILSIIIISCKQNSFNKTKKVEYYANQQEIKIIDNLDCWESYYAELTMNILRNVNNTEEKEKYWEQWKTANEEARKKGIENLKNDTILINVLRNSESYGSLKSERKDLTKKLMKFQKKIPYFSSTLEKIMKNIIEYKYYRFGEEFGIYEGSFSKELKYTSYETFYINYIKLMKEAYSEYESTITDEELIDMVEILNRIENIDRIIWIIPCYEEKKRELEAELLKLKKERLFDSLISNKK